MLAILHTCVVNLDLRWSYVIRFCDFISMLLVGEMSLIFNWFVVKAITFETDNLCYELEVSDSRWKLVLFEILAVAGS